MFNEQEFIHIPSNEDIRNIKDPSQSIEKAFLKNESLAIGKQLNYIDVLT